MGGWTGDWVWGLPMITVSLMVHVAGLTLIGVLLTRLSRNFQHRRSWRTHPIVVFIVTIGLTALLLAVLHGIDACLWALCYVALGAMENYSIAVFYSLGMMTTVGAEVLTLKPHWELLGRLEAVCGMLLFGMSTAFLFAVLQRVWPYLLRDARDASR